MKQIGFIILISISGIYAMYHHQFIHRTGEGSPHAMKNHKINHEPGIQKITEVKESPAQKINDWVTFKPSIVFNQLQAVQSDDIIHDQINNEFLIQSSNFMSEENIKTSDKDIADQFSGTVYKLNDPMMGSAFISVSQLSVADQFLHVQFNNENPEL